MKHSDAWLDPNQPWRALCRLDNSDQGPLSNFPARVSIPCPAPKASTIRFYNAAGTQIAHEVDVAIDGEKVVCWVLIASVPDSTTLDFWAYWGGSPKAMASAPTGVWDGDFMMVHHFSQQSGDYIDSTTNDNDGTTVTVTSRNNKKVGYCPEFDGDDDEINCGSDATLDDITTITIEAYAYAISEGETFGRVYDKTRKLIYTDANGKLNFFQDFDGAVNGSWVTDDAVWSSWSTWHYAAITYNDGAVGNNPIIYIDGAAVAITETATPQGSAVSDAASSVLIGNDNSGASTWDGLIEELRVSDVIRTADWIAATYLCLTDGYVTVAPPEHIGGRLDALRATTAQTGAPQRLTTRESKLQWELTKGGLKVPPRLRKLCPYGKGGVPFRSDGG